MEPEPDRETKLPGLIMNVQLSLEISRQCNYADPDFIKYISSSSDEEWLSLAEERRNDSNCSKTILSLFDYSGQWSKPYHDAGYNVICLDLKHGNDINDFCVKHLLDDLGIDIVYGILAGVPCTEFANSGARWFIQKDKDGRTQAAIELVNQTLRTVEFYDPEFWVIENPVGRLGSLVPELDVKPFYFNPCDYARGFDKEDYTKKTGLWGKFVPPSKNNLGDDRSVYPYQGSKMHKLYGGKSERTKMMRSITPLGFANAFYECNR